MSFHGVQENKSFDSDWPVQLNMVLHICVNLASRANFNGLGARRFAGVENQDVS